MPREQEDDEDDDYDDDDYDEEDNNSNHSKGKQEENPDSENLEGGSPWDKKHIMYTFYDTHHQASRRCQNSSKIDHLYMFGLFLSNMLVCLFWLACRKVVRGRMRTCLRGEGCRSMSMYVRKCSHGTSYIGECTSSSSACTWIISFLRNMKGRGGPWFCPVFFILLDRKFTREHRLISKYVGIWITCLPNDLAVCVYAVSGIHVAFWRFSGSKPIDRVKRLPVRLRNSSNNTSQTGRQKKSVHRQKVRSTLWHWHTSSRCDDKPRGRWVESIGENDSSGAAIYFERMHPGDLLR